MLRKMVVIGVVLFALVNIGNLSSAEPWKQGETWGYKWEYDLSKEMSAEANNFTGTLTADGKVAYLYYVKYVDMENGKYRFDFAGTFYAWAHISGKGSSGGSTGEANLDIKSLWINFDGYYYLEKDNTYDWFNGENHTYYKMTYLNMHIYTKKDVDVSMDYKLNTGGHNSQGSISIKGNFDMKLEITFDSGVPYLPGEADTFSVYEYTYADYKAHIKANVEVKGEGEYGNGQMNFNLNKNYSGSVYMYSSLDVKANGNQIKVTKPSIISESGKNALYPFGGVMTLLTKSDPNVDTYISSLQNVNEAIYDSSSGYYTKQKVGSFGYLSVGNDYSSSASVNEVNDARNNAPAKYGEYGGSFWMYMIIIVVAIVAFLVVIILVAVRRKRSIEQYPQQQQNQQYPQYPQQPPQKPPANPPNYP